MGERVIMCPVDGWMCTPTWLRSEKQYNIMLARFNAHCITISKLCDNDQKQTIAKLIADNQRGCEIVRAHFVEKFISYDTPDDLIKNINAYLSRHGLVQ